LKKTSAPVRELTLRELTTGVRCAAPAICAAALSMSAKVGSVTFAGVAIAYFNFPSSSS
jgi:hypothetical protein